MTSAPRPTGREAEPATIASGSGLADTELADTEPADTEPADTAPADTAPADTEPADTELADTEESHADPSAERVPVPENQAGIDALRLEIDAVDADIVRLIKRRTAISNAIGAARKSLGGPRIVYSREMAILERFRELGPAGTDLGMMLLAMGRGRLGRK